MVEHRPMASKTKSALAKSIEKSTAKSTVRSLPCGRALPPSMPPPSEEKLRDLQSKLRDYLSEQNLKYTEQRWQIARIVFTRPGHFDAQDLVDLVNREYPEIGAATVYRNLKVLVDSGMLEKSHQSVDGRELYEVPAEEHHDHIICLDCGEILEFQNPKIETLQDQIAKEFSFDLIGHRHVIHGRCQYLKQKRKSPS